MSEDKKQKINNTISLVELETDLEAKELMLKQVESAHQQLLGQINCLKALIAKVKGEDKKEQKPGETKK